MNKCEEFQHKVLELENFDFVEEELQMHLDQCPSCENFFNARALLEEGLRGLPEADASNELVAATLAMIEKERLSQEQQNKADESLPEVNPESDTKLESSKKRAYLPWSNGLAASIVCFSIITLFMQGHISIPDFDDLPITTTSYDTVEEDSSAEFNDEVLEIYQDKEFEPEPAPAPAPALPPKSEVKAKTKPATISRREIRKQDQRNQEYKEIPEQPPTEEVLIAEQEPEEIIVQGMRSSLNVAVETKREHAGVVDSIAAHDIGTLPDQNISESIQRLAGISLEDSVAREEGAGPGRLRQKAGKINADGDDFALVERDFVNARSNEAIISTTSSNNSLDVARAWLETMDSTSGLSFQNATGYWANTYLPSDPDMRWLGLSLQQKNLPSDFSALLSKVERNIQPLDQPTSSALAVYLQADKKSISGKNRVKMQIGIQASERESGQRANMNMGLVINLSENFSSEQIEKVQALLTALLKAGQSGDSFYLELVSPLQNYKLKAEEFRHGHIQVLLNNLHEALAAGGGARSPELRDLALTQAFENTRDWIHEFGEPQASLGANMILFASADKLGDKFTRLEDLGHQLANEGINLSTVAIGEGTDRRELDLLAMAGQGHSRVLLNVEQAEELIHKELFASSRIVAKAVRLSIRLAKGVQLVDVLGSHPLNEERAERVRQAEQSIDQSLSQSMGITADRGNDEEGIQIVIPGFYSGDTHLILLDLVTEGPGDIAEVSLRYKDILFLRNGISLTQLSVPRGNTRAGQLELNVQKNILSRQFSEALGDIARMLDRNEDIEKILFKVRHLKLRYQGLRQLVPLWKEDRELIRDENILDELVGILEESSIQLMNTELSDLLEYASWIKWTKENAISEQHIKEPANE